MKHGLDPKTKQWEPKRSENIYIKTSLSKLGRAMIPSCKHSYISSYLY